MKKILLAFLFLTQFASTPLHAGVELTEFHWEIDHKTTTEFPDCEEYVEGILKMCALIIQTKDKSDRDLFIGIVQDLKKSLHKCEKKCKKKTTGVTIGGKHQIK
jgi:hypothetical protein